MKRVSKGVDSARKRRELIIRVCIYLCARVHARTSTYPTFSPTSSPLDSSSVGICIAVVDTPYVLCKIYTFRYARVRRRKNRLHYINAPFYFQNKNMQFSPLLGDDWVWHLILDTYSLGTVHIPLCQHR